MQTSTKMLRCERQYRADGHRGQAGLLPGGVLLDANTHPFLSFAGIDWGSYEHAACLLANGKRHQRRFPHSPDGLQGLVSWLLQHAPRESLAVAIEVPHGPVVEALQDAAIDVFAINPKQLDRFRDRHTVAGAKDDRLDAFVLADSLRTDLHRFTLVPPPDAFTVELRTTSRLYQRFTDDLRASSNQLWQRLLLTAPQLLDLCHGADEPWFWDLCGRVLVDGVHPRRTSIARLLKQHHKRTSPDDVLAAVAAPRLSLPASGQAAVLHISLLLPLLRTLHTQREAARAHLRELVPQAGDTAAIVDSQPGIDLISTAVFLAEASTALANADGDALRALCGTAPITRQSGISHKVVMRRACNTRLRNVARNWARTAIRCEPRSRAHYDRLRAHNCRHERALRGVADRLLTRLIASLRDATLYDSDRWNAPRPPLPA